LPFIDVVRGSFRVSAGEAEQDVAQKLEMGMSGLGVYSTRNLGLLLHLLGLKVPDDSLKGLDGVLIGLRTRELLQQLLEARCRLSPVVMTIEDLHWIDSASAELLAKIVESQAKLRLLLLTTRRPEYVPPWLDRSPVMKLPLEPLPSEDIRHLVQAQVLFRQTRKNRLVYLVLAECRLILPEAQAPQPNHDVHDGVPYSGLPHIMVPAPKGVYWGARGNQILHVSGLADQLRPHYWSHRRTRVHEVGGSLAGLGRQG
jgi:hypothetical protein